MELANLLRSVKSYHQNIFRFGLKTVFHYNFSITFRLTLNTDVSWPFVNGNALLFFVNLDQSSNGTTLEIVGTAF